MAGSSYDPALHVHRPMHRTGGHMWIILALWLSYVLHRRLYYHKAPQVQRLRADHTLLDAVASILPERPTRVERRTARTLSRDVILEAHPNILRTYRRWTLRQVMQETEQRQRQTLAKEVVEAVRSQA